MNEHKLDQTKKLGKNVGKKLGQKLNSELFIYANSN